MSVFPSMRSRVVFLLLGLLAGAVALGLAGCGGDKEVDPYVYASLRAVTRGDTTSNDFLFEIDAPQFEYVKGNAGIVRDGNLLEFVVGQDLEANYTSYAGALLGVQKYFSPSPYLMIKRVKRGGVADTLAVATDYHLPRVIKISQDELQTSGAALPDLDWKKVEDVKIYLPKEEGGQPIQVQSVVNTLVRAPRHTLTPEQQASAGPRDHAWYAVFPNSSFELVNLTPGVEWMLELLVAKRLPLQGSFTITEVVENYADRKTEHPRIGNVLGKLQINWFRYANTYIKGSAD